MQLSNRDYIEAIETITSNAEASDAYIDKFKFEFPEGLNSPSVLRICELLEDASFKGRTELAGLCLDNKRVVIHNAGKTASVTFAGGLGAADAMDVFREEPFCLMALINAVWGHVVKKSIPQSQGRGAAGGK